MQGYLLFHLNLAYSSLPEDRRRVVIERCYDPLLDIIENHGVPLGIEASGWTLTEIAGQRPDWVERFRGLLRAGSCELVGSGYTQIIGPLIPHRVNKWNQELGLETYQQLLGVTPQIALINEMAFSSGMVGVYREAGYRGIIMDGDNIALSLGLHDHNELPLLARGDDENSLPVLWSDSILFQKLQRVAHGDISINDYLSYVKKRGESSKLPLALYANDAEVFDFRPGRYSEEPDQHEGGEWKRIVGLLAKLEQQGMSWITPSQALRLQQVSGKPVTLITAQQPIPVKKQAKYNVSRWAVSGRNDLRINTLCQRIFRQLMHRPELLNNEVQRSLCRCWSSDLRTHIESRRWEKANAELEALASSIGVATTYPFKLKVPGNKANPEDVEAAGFSVLLDEEGILLMIASSEHRIVLNLRRGLAIDSLAFRKHNFIPVMGTLPHGYFHSIELGADFYSFGTVIEWGSEHRRTTDLGWPAPEFYLDGGALTVRGEIDTPDGKIVKQIVVSSEDDAVELITSFPDWKRPYGTVRLGTITLLPETFKHQLSLRTVNGGAEAETLVLDRDCNHGLPASTLVSCRGGLGSPEGMLRIGDGNVGLSVSWDPSECAAFPMLYHHNVPPSALTRVIFSLSELDETSRPGGKLPTFRQILKPTTEL